MKRKMCFFFVAALVLSISLCSCGEQQGETKTQNTAGLDKLGTLQAVAREEGSGTRAVFAQLVGLENESSSEKKSDLTREDAQIENSGDAVMTAVKNSQSTIGYASIGALSDDGAIKSLSVAGVTPDADTIESGKYPLSRSFYLAYSGDASELEQDFMTYVSGVGQDVVKEDFVAVGSVKTFLSSKTAGKLTINGSTSVAPLMKKLVAGYNKYNPNAEITIKESDSTQGLTAAMQRKCDLAMASRDLESYEKELLKYEMIAKDGILVVVNKENPLSDITMEQLKDIYDGTIKEWDQLSK